MITDFQRGDTLATLKYSKQREMIKEFLMTRKDHPTADIVYIGAVCYG